MTSGCGLALVLILTQGMLMNHQCVRAVALKEVRISKLDMLCCGGSCCCMAFTFNPVDMLIIAISSLWSVAPIQSPYCAVNDSSQNRSLALMPSFNMLLNPLQSAAITFNKVPEHPDRKHTLPGAAWLLLHSLVTRTSMILMCDSGLGSQLRREMRKD